MMMMMIIITIVIVIMFQMTQEHCFTLAIALPVFLLLEIFFPVALRPNAGHGLLILEVSRSHTTTHHSR
jgi:hypothetical protein